MLLLPLSPCYKSRDSMNFGGHPSNTISDTCDIFQKFAVKFPAHGQIIPVKCNQGCLPFDRKFRKFRMEGKW